MVIARDYCSFFLCWVARHRLHRLGRTLTCSLLYGQALPIFVTLRLTFLLAASFACLACSGTRRLLFEFGQYALAWRHTFVWPTPRSLLPCARCWTMLSCERKIKLLNGPRVCVVLSTMLGWICRKVEVGRRSSSLPCLVPGCILLALLLLF